MYTLISIHTTPIEAHIIKGRLEAEGISGVVLFEHHIWAQWSLSHVLGCVRLLVPASMVESAYEILHGINSGEFEQLVTAEQGNSRLACPRCDSSNTGVHAWVWKLALVLLFTISLPFPYSSHLYSCDDCKHSWIAHDQRPYPLPVIALYIIFVPLFVCLIYLLASYFSSLVMPGVVRHRP